MTAAAQISHSPEQVVAAMDGASVAFERLREEARADGRVLAAGPPEDTVRRVVLLARDCIDYSWEELHAGPWCAPHCHARARSCQASLLV